MQLQQHRYLIGVLLNSLCHRIQLSRVFLLVTKNYFNDEEMNGRL